MAQITEPTTLISDFILGSVCIILFLKIMKSNLDSQKVKKMWSYAILSTGLGAYLGSISHGFHEFYSEGIGDVIWTATTLSIGIGVFAMLLGTAYGTLAVNQRKLLVYFALLQILVYTGYMLFVSTEFFIVIINYLTAMLIVGVLHFIKQKSEKIDFGYAVIFGILITLIASVFQITTADLLPDWFNNNDLFHYTQIPGMYLFYKAALKAKDIFD